MFVSRKDLKESVAGIATISVVGAGVRKVKRAWLERKAPLGKRKFSDTEALQVDNNKLYGAIKSRIKVAEAHYLLAEATYKKLDEALKIDVEPLKKIVQNKALNVIAKQLAIESGYKEDFNMEEWLKRMRDLRKKEKCFDILYNILYLLLENAEEVEGLKNLIKEEGLFKRVFLRAEGREYYIYIVLKNIILAEENNKKYSFIQYLSYIGRLVVIDIKEIYVKGLILEEKNIKEKEILDTFIKKEGELSFNEETEMREDLIKEVVHYLATLNLLKIKRFTTRKEGEKKPATCVKIKTQMPASFCEVIRKSLTSRNHAERETRYPLLLEPEPWTRDRRGGYLRNKLIFTDKLIHGKKGASCEIKGKRLEKPLYNVINYLQKMPLSINTLYLRFIASVLEGEEGSPEKILLFPYLSNKKGNLGEKETIRNRYHAFRVAEILAVENNNEYYNAYYYCSRLRILSTSLLSVENETFIRSFAVSKKKLPLGKKGLEELLVYGGSLRKETSKASREEKLTFIKEQKKHLWKEYKEEGLLKIKQTTGNKFYPYIAWFLELENLGYFKENLREEDIKAIERKESGFLIELDTLASNITILSLLLGDDTFSKELRLEKLKEGEKILDIYTLCLTELQTKLLSTNFSKEWVFALPRLIIKKPIMIYFYSAGARRRRREIIEIFRETFKNIKMRKEEKLPFLNAIVNEIETVLLTKFARLNVLQEAVRTAEKAIDKIEWSLPDKHEIQQNYRKSVIKRRRYKAGFYFITPRKKYFLESKNLRKSNRSVLANVIQSIDALILRKVVSRFRETLHRAKKVHSYRINHDAYYIHPSQAEALKKDYLAVINEIFTVKKIKKLASSLKIPEGLLLNETSNKIRKHMLKNMQTAPELLS